MLKVKEFYAKLGSEEVLIKNATIEFPRFPEDTDENTLIDTLAGSLIVEDVRNRPMLAELTHEEKIDGAAHTVSYGLNAERIEVRKAKEKATATEGDNKPKGNRKDK